VGQAWRRKLLKVTESAAHSIAVHSMKTTSHNGEGKDTHSHTLNILTFSKIIIILTKEHKDTTVLTQRTKMLPFLVTALSA
jgi:hypothetical protein